MVEWQILFPIPFWTIFLAAHKKWISRTQDGTKFVDLEFNIDSKLNWGDKKQKNGTIGAEWTRPPPDMSFIDDGIDAFDIAQGKTGDCWFLSSISALAEKRKLVKKVLMPQVIKWS